MENKSNLAWARRVLYAFAALGALSLASCSAIRVTYNNADLWLRWTANRYFDLQPSQAEELRMRIARLHQWHRAHELPLYVELLRAAAARVNRGLTDQDVAWGAEAVRGRYRALVARGASEFAPLLVALRPEQIAHLENRFAEDNQKYAKRFLSGDEKRRATARTDRIAGHLNDWIGKLTDAQEQRVSAMVRSTPTLAENGLAERRRHQAELLDILRSDHRPDSLAPRITDLLVNWEAHRTPEQARDGKYAEAQFFRMLLDLDRMLGAEQRGVAVQRLQRYADDFGMLARQAPDTSSQRAAAGELTVD
jgi:hypothetical protein